MVRIETEIEIQAPIEQVWQLLTEVQLYPDWNPFIREIDGQIQVGEKLTVKLQPPGSSGMTFRPKVVKVQPQHEFRWIGHFVLPGLFDGEHCFKLELIDANRVRFVHEEQFRGLLVPLFKQSLMNETKQGFEAMNHALKQKAESISAS